jgi:AraC family transcriptional regulator
MDDKLAKRAIDPIEPAHNLSHHLHAQPAHASMDQHWRGLVALHYLDCVSNGGIALPRLDSDCLMVPLTPMADLGIRGEVLIGSCDVAPGEVAILPRKMSSTWRWSGKAELMFLLPERVVMQEIAASMTEKDVERFELDAALNTRAPLIHQIALEMRAELQSDGLHGSIYAETLIQTLCAHLVLRHSSFGTGRAAASGGLDEKRLRNAIAYIVAHLSEEISIHEVAKAVHLSPFHFARAFKVSTGRPPHQFVIERRIERAKQMLQSTKLQITEIAAECGFQSQSHFGILFRRRTGLTPNVYREAR